MGRKGFEVRDGKVVNYQPPMPKNGYPENEFVNLELSKEQRTQLKEMFVDALDLDMALAEIFDDGTKITLKFDDRNDCYVAFGFAPADSDNAGYVLTGRGGSATRALRELVYKHLHILNGDWASYHNRAANRDGDDW
jgi:hypothetical protein